MRIVPIVLSLLLAACASGPAHSSDPPPAADTVDDRCTTDADCEVKNVGNCCGYVPACVSKDAKVDPAAVRAECERTGMSSVCGFQDIQACDCAQGQCRAVSGKALEVDG